MANPASSARYLRIPDIVPNLEAPERFYQYWPVAADERKTWLATLLRDRLIYFRDRRSLNDPNELRPRAVLMGTTEEKRDYVRRIIRTYGKPMSPAKRLVHERAFLQRIEMGMVPLEADLHGLLERIGILSLSASPEIGLLWAHYGEGYRGICVEFDSAAGLFVGAQPVTYTDEQPIINRLTDDNDVVFRKSMFTKSKAWQYEKEWRVIARYRDQVKIEQHVQQHGWPADMAEFIRASHGPGYYSIPNGAITALVSGPQMAPVTLGWLTDLRDQLAPTLPILTSRVRPDGSVEVLRPPTSP